MGCGNMRMIIGATHIISILMAPGRPGFPVKAIAVCAFRDAVRLIIEHAFLYAILLRPIALLNITKKCMVHKLLQFCYFSFVWLHQLLHHGAQPTAGYPYAAILLNLLFLFVIICYYRWVSMKSIRLIKPLLVSKKMPEILHQVMFRFDHLITDGLAKPIGISDG
jgi:hypothetical protein